MLLSIQNEILPLNSKTKMKNIKFKLQDSFMVTPASGKKKEKKYRLEDYHKSWSLYTVDL